MYNPNYEPEKIDRLTPPVTIGEARKKAAYHGKLVQSPNFDIETSSGRYDWECLSYYRGIILKSNGKRRNGTNS